MRLQTQDLDRGWLVWVQVDARTIYVDTDAVSKRELQYNRGMSESTANRKAARLLEIQALFDPFNRGGSVLKVEGGPHDQPVHLGVIDSYQVTRVQGDQFWLFFKQTGYDTETRLAHTVKIVSWTQGDTWLIDLVDDQGCRLHIELIFPAQDVDQYEEWRRWRRYKSRRRKWFRVIDRDFLETHVEAAKAWEEWA